MKKARLDRSFRERFESSSSQVSSCCSSETKKRIDNTGDEKKDYKNHIRSAKCRRSLQSLYDQSFDAIPPEENHNENNALTVDKTDQKDKENKNDDFDEYLQLYKSVSEKLTEKGNIEKHKMIYETWKKNKSIASKEKCEIPSKISSPDSGVISSPSCVPEWTDIDSGVWPLQSNIDVNATDEQNILDVESDVWEPLALDSEGNIQDAIVPLSSINCVDMESEMSVVNLSNDNQQVPQNKNEKLSSPRTVSIAPKWDITFDSGLTNNGDNEDNMDNVKPLFILDKDIWLQSEPPGSVDEELHKYLADFSPPSKKNLLV